MKNKKEIFPRAKCIYHCRWCRYGHDACKWDTMKVHTHPDRREIKCLKCKARFIWQKKKLKSGLFEMKNNFKIKVKHPVWIG